MEDDLQRLYEGGSGSASVPLTKCRWAVALSEFITPTAQAAQRRARRPT